MKLFYLSCLLALTTATGAVAQTRPKPGAAPVRLTTKEKLKARADAEIARREAAEQAAVQAREAEEKADKERREKSKALDRARKKNGGLDLAEQPAEDPSKPKIFIGKVKLSDPVLVYYQQPPPGTGRQQLVMDKANLGLLAKLSTEDLMLRREVFVDGLGNYALPGTNQTKTRLVGASLVADDARKPAGDGRSTYVRLKVKGPDLYVVRESADEYRHFVKGKVQESVIDFNINSLSGIDSVRAVYTLRKIDASERGAGSGDIIR